MELPEDHQRDDHVVEPAARVADVLRRSTARRAAHVERKRWGGFIAQPGRQVHNTEDPNGCGYAWYFGEDASSTCTALRRRSPSRPLPDGDLSKLRRSKMVMEALTYDEMRPGCYEARRAWSTWSQLGRRFAAFPTFPRFCARRLRADDQRARDCAWREGVQRLRGSRSGASRRTGSTSPMCLMPLS